MKKFTVLDIIDINLSNYPNDSFSKLETKTSEEGTTSTEYIKVYDQNELLGLFSELSVITFENSTAKNFIFNAGNGEDFPKQKLKKLVNSIFEIYGPDDMGEELFLNHEWEEIEYEEFWGGRMWQRDSLPVHCSIGYFDEDGLTFTIWTK